MLKCNSDFHKPQEQLKKMHLLARFGLQVTNLETIRPPNSLHREGKTSNLKMVSFKFSP